MVLFSEYITLSSHEFVQYILMGMLIPLRSHCTVCFGENEKVSNAFYVRPCRKVYWGENVTCF